MTATFVLVLSLPCVYLPAAGIASLSLQAAGIERVCSDADLTSADALPTPGTTPRPGLASPTRSPWIVANGWRFMRYPDRKYVYDAPVGKAILAAAEAFAYGGDAILKIDAADVDALGSMLKFLDALPAVDLPLVADVGVIDDGSAVTGEIMNLLARRNLLFQIVQTPSPRFRINVAVGSPAFPREDAADPSAFALKIRRQLGDDQRALRIFGSEVVIARLTGDTSRVRLHLIDYGGRGVEGLRVRLRGSYASGEAHVAGSGTLPLQDHLVSGGYTEFSIPRISTYAVIELRSSR